MSLKGFHLFFIFCSVLCSLYFGMWALQYSQYTAQLGYRLAGIIALTVALLLTVYGIVVRKKLNDRQNGHAK